MDRGDGPARAGRPRVQVQAGECCGYKHAGGGGVLFTPYSVFTVLGVHVPASSNDEDPVIVWVMAAVDNLKDKLIRKRQK